MTQAAQARPTYLLGAGFSKAVSHAMPITNELGASLGDRLANEIGFELRPGQTFEDWLTLQVTPLPFLQGFENSRRAADASRVIAEIATVLDLALERAAADAAPPWLLQLIALWHAERAAVLTFNYDTLIERGVNTLAPTSTSRDGSVGFIQGDEVVFPAPPAPSAQFLGDSGVGYSGESFQLLKLHGSLAWYWGSGDATGSTLVRLREKHVLGRAEPLAAEADFAGATKLDRYIIPPVTSKDGYYSSYLANAIWRDARSQISTATSLTLIGYSLPHEDRVASELVAQLPDTAPVTVVDRDPGTVNQRPSVLANLRRLGIDPASAIGGEDCVERFVAAKLHSAISTLPAADAFDELENPNADVVVAVSQGWGHQNRGDLYVLVWNESNGTFEAHGVPSTARQGSSMPYRESVLNSMPSGHRRLGDFVTAARLRAHIQDGAAFRFTLPMAGRTAVGIGVRRLKAERWEILGMQWAPSP
ncbi:hypothetical protein ABCS02_32360 [Microbacterium sp. X-17]|uniref:hypothetical protein n=1 Tax=Microbacterium sp. X-17 TaxID=3144404 RepID=UPI0031F47FBD